MNLKACFVWAGVLGFVVAGVGTAPTYSQSAGVDEILSVDHYVLHHSTMPAIAGDAVQLYVRERVGAGVGLRARDLEGRVVLFVHGAGTPAEVAFDVPYEDYSWMAYLARAGFDVFSMDVTGYGRSTRPASMNDPCNVSPDQQTQLVGVVLSAGCSPSSPGALGTIDADWDDIGAVVDYIRDLRDVDSVSLVGWSLGGPRTGGYAIRNADKISRMVLLAPAYNRNSSGNRPSPGSGTGAPMTLQSSADFTSNWDRQVGCESQYDPNVSAAVWSEMLLSDPIGATWGPGVRRAPRTATWGWNGDVARDTETPILIVAGVHDAQVPPDRARDLYDDWGGEDKVFIDLGCASHNAMWERNHLLLFEASREWLTSGTVHGMNSGVLRMGYR